MRTEVIKQDCSCVNEEELKRAGAIIKKGGLVAFPTETVYGLGGDALNPESSKKIYAAKGRPSDNPLIVHICCMEDYIFSSCNSNRHFCFYYSILISCWFFFINIYFLYFFYF